MSTMGGYVAMTRSEFRLFRREPFSVVFVLVFPLMMMVLLAAVFGNKQADAHKIQNGMLIWRGVTPANYYTAASVAVIVAALGLMTLPIALTSYRERGILRRFHASSVPASTLVGSQLTLALGTFVAGTVVMAVVARLAYHAMLPQNVLGVVVSLLAGTAAFGAIGLLLATVIRTSRSAQGIGLMLFFALWLISGTAPPRAVLPAGLRDVGGVLPLSHLVTAVQNAWFGFGWAGSDLAVLAAFAVAAGVPALWLFRDQSSS
jgi:ABC-2 type transport system permease protein